VLVTGGDRLLIGRTYLSSAEVYDPFFGSWSTIPSMISPRTYHTATLLPSGKVLVTGGYIGTNYLSSTETYDPGMANASWKAAGALTAARIGHAATLLVDGRVLITGGHTTNSLTSAEVFNPYVSFSNVPQPQVTSATTLLDPGSNLTVTGSQFRGNSEASGGNTQDSSADYPLVQLRSIETGWMTFLPATNWSTNSFASAPVWNFPPGYALATVFVNGVPGTSTVVSVTVPLPAEILLVNAGTTNGSFQFSFINTPGAVFGVLASTNIALPLSNWTALGGVTELSPGNFQFTDAQPPPDQRFYRVRSL
jgi:Galactose oxidase, central domain